MKKQRLWNQLCTESLEYRALLVKNGLQLSTKVNEEIATDPHQPAKYRIDASKVMVEAQIHLFNILKEGPSLR